MAAIYLIRHGQACFDKADYDQLSSKGKTQALKLGKHWQSLARPGKFFTGNLLRHGQTFEHFLCGYSSSDAQQSLPANKHAGFNEFDHLEILHRYQPKWRDFSLMSDEFSNQENPEKAVQQAFSQALNRWVSAAYDHEYRETWSQFKTRCIAALQDVIAEVSVQQESPASKDIVIFTSAGPIAVIIQHILALSDQHTLMINQQLKNTGVTKLLFSGQRSGQRAGQKLSIDYINNYRHLELADSPDYV